MIENPDNPPGAHFDEGSSEPDPGSYDDLIELSDIAIGTTEEDEEIIELTEEVVDEAMEAVSDTREDGDGPREIDLSGSDGFFHTREPAGEDDTGQDQWQPSEAVETHEESLSGISTEDVEGFLDQELDAYFGEEEAEAFEFQPAADAGEKKPGTATGMNVSPDMLDAALERVITKLYADRVEKIIKDMIDKRVSEHMARLQKKQGDASDA